MYNLKIYKSNESEKEFIPLLFNFDVKNMFDSKQVEANIKEIPSIIIYNYSEPCTENDIKFVARWSFEAEYPYNMVDEKNKKEFELFRSNNFNCDLFCGNKNYFKYISNMEDISTVLQDLFFRKLDFSIIK